MESQQLNLDVIANNLANVNTTGFKKSKIEFQDLIYQTTRAPGPKRAAATKSRPASKSATAPGQWPLPRFSPPAN